MLIFEYILLLLITVLVSNIINRFIPMLTTPIIQIALGILIVIAPFGVYKFHFEFEPELFFLLFISPLIYHSSLKIDKSIFWKMRKNIIYTAILLVFITVIFMGYFVHILIPSIPLAACFALIAALGPTDVVAVDSVGKRIAVPKRIMSVLTGESIINDASGIVCFLFAIAAATTGSFSLIQATEMFFKYALGGIILGVLLTGIKYLIVRGLRSLGMENVTLHVLIDIMTPFIIFMVVEAFSMSGILAVFAAGIMHSIKRDQLDPSRANFHNASENIWTTLAFCFDGIVFVILGTQIPDIVETIYNRSFTISTPEIFGYILLIVLIFMIIRFLWWIFIIGKSAFENSDTKIKRWKAALIFSLSGARGTVTLAIAMSIPLTLSNGDPFPERDLIILIATGVIICTLLITNFVLPLFVDKKTSKKMDVDEKRACLKILNDVILHMREQETSENTNEVEFIIRSYHNRSIAMRRTQLNTFFNDPMEKEIRQQVIDWEKEYTNIQVEKGEVDKETANNYLTMLDSSIIAKRAGKNRSISGRLTWVFKAYRNIFKYRNDNSVVDKYAKLSEDNREYAQKKLEEIKNKENQAIVEKLILEITLLRSQRAAHRNNMDQSINNTIDKTRLSKMISIAFQYERDTIQEMYEQGRISRETAKEMRANIALLQTEQLT